MEVVVSIETTLSSVGVPTLDTSFFAPTQTQQLQHSFQANKKTRILSAFDRLSKVRPTPTPSNRVRAPALDWSHVQPEARDHLVQYFASKTGTYTQAEIHSLQKLPVFALQNGSYTALTSSTTTTTTTTTRGGGSSKTNGEAKQQDYYYLKQADTPLPDMIAGNSRILKRKQNSKQTALYNELGVQELKAVDLFQKFIVPEFDGLSRVDQSKFTEQLCTEWSTLKKNASLVDTLKQLQFIPTGNQQHAR